MSPFKVFVCSVASGVVLAWAGLLFGVLIPELVSAKSTWGVVAGVCVFGAFTSGVIAVGASVVGSARGP